MGTTERYIVVELDTDTWNTGGAYDDDPWSRDSSEGRTNDATARVARDFEVGKYGNGNADNWARETWGGFLAVDPGETLFAVSVDYTTGDTFGSDPGFATLYVTQNYDKAREFRDAVDKHGEGRGDGNDRYTLTFDGVEYHAPWVGYFETFDRSHLHTLTVQG